MTRDTIYTEDRELTNTRSMSEAGHSMSRQLVRQAQLPPNSIQDTIGEPQIQNNNTGSPSQSSPEKDLSQEELEKKLNKYSTLLSEYERNRTNRAKGKQKAHSDSVKARQKKISYCHQGVLEEMLMIMEHFNAKGFVYGMVPETSKLMTGASDSLRAWWKREAMFDKVGPAKIEQYFKANALYSNVADPDNKSTAELLKELSDPTLGSILSLLMQNCDPPQRKFPFENGLPPPWWPTAQEDWWDQTGIPTEEGPPPFRKPHNLKKKWKVAMIIGIIKLMSPNFSGLHSHLVQSRKLASRLNAKEKKFWTLALMAEARLYCQHHPDMPVNEAVAFLNAYGGNSSQKAPPISEYEAPHSSNHLEVTDQHSHAPLSNNTLAWPIRAPQYGQPRESIQEISAGPIPAMSEGYTPQYSPWVNYYNPTNAANLSMYLQQSHTVGTSGASNSGFGHHFAQAIPHSPFVQQSYHFAQAIPNPPFVQQPGDMPSTGGTHHAQNHGNGENMESGFEHSSGNQNSESWH